MNSNEKNILPKTWEGLDDENIVEIDQIIEDALEDAVLMGADPKQVIKVIIKSLEEKNSDN